MNLLELPNEILVMILEQLDLKTKISVASSCEHLASVMCRSDLIGHVSFSRTTFAVQILRHETFHTLAPYIRELELSNVSKLDKTWLVPTLELMRSLRSLNLSLTDITLFDLAGVCELCPHLSRLSVNYSRPYCDIPKLGNMTELKKSFRRLEYIHLLGDIKAFNTLDAIRILQDSKLKEFKITTIKYMDEYDLPWEPFQNSFGEFPFKIFSAFITDNFNGSNVPLFSIPIIEGLYKHKWEYVVISGSCVTVSPDFYESYSGTHKSYLVSGNLRNCRTFENVKVFMWHPDLAFHNPNFRKEIMLTVMRCRPQFVCAPGCSAPIESIGDSYIYISASNFTEYIIRYPDDLVPWKPSEYYALLNIDRFLHLGDELKLSFIRMVCHLFPCVYYPLTVGPNTHVYRNIVYLYFDPDMDRYLNSNFLSALFQNCARLETLFYDNDVKHLEDSLAHSKSLKNLMVFNRIFKPLPFVQGVAKCLSLENIHICDGSFDSEIEHMRHFTEGLSELVRSCPHLYNLEYHADWGKQARNTQMLSIVKALKDTGRDLRCELAYYDHDWSAYKGRIEINPFSQVFLGHDMFKLISNTTIKLPSL